VTTDALSDIAMTAPAAARNPAPAAVGDQARRDALVRAGSGLALWSSVLLIGYWWAAGGGLSDLAGWSGALDSIGRLSGSPGPTGWSASPRSR
jgi:hypothetical protein